MSGDKINTYGCPEYFVDTSSIEVMGSNIRLSFGVKRGDQVEGVFSMVMTAEFALACSKVCQEISRDAAFRALKLSEGKMAAH